MVVFASNKCAHQPALNDVVLEIIKYGNKKHGGEKNRIVWRSQAI